MNQKDYELIENQNRSIYYCRLQIIRNFMIKTLEKSHHLFCILTDLNFYIIKKSKAFDNPRKRGINTFLVDRRSKE
jgi:hypothetical protein